MGQLREIDDVKKPLKGMATDTSPLNQVPNSYRFALNMCAESREGDYSALVNEEGNEECFQIEDNEIVIGTILISNGDTVIFIATEDQTYSKISIVDKNCNLTNIITSSCLNFSKAHPIHGTFKINNGCDRVIYFTDNYNPFRSLNLDNLGQYTPRIGVSEIDWIADANLNDSWKCELIKVAPDVLIPSIELLSEYPGAGELQVGAYLFSIRYLDDSFNFTNWFYITNPANVGFPLVTNAIDHLTNYDGGILASPDIFIGTALEFELTNLDTNFPYYQLGVIEYSEGTQDITSAYMLPFTSFTSSTDTYLFTGRESRLDIPIEDITVPFILFNRVGSIAQTDNRLVIANLSSDVKDWSIFQVESSKIKTYWSSKWTSKFEAVPFYAPQLEDASTSLSSFQLKSFQRDEIYALGIVYVFNDGSESPVFHIPGRPANVGYNRMYGDFTNANLLTHGNNNVHRRNQVPIGQNWDTQLITIVADGALVDFDTEIEEKNVVHIPLNEFVGSPIVYVGSTIERWKVYNTAVIRDTFGSSTTDRIGQEGVLGYYEGDETYQDIQTCNGDSIWGEDAWGNALVNTPIRHHKIPDGTLVVPDFGYREGPVITSNSVILPIHLHVDNVTIPTQFLSQIQGYYIVMANREEENATVLDNGMLGGVGLFGGTAQHTSHYSLTDITVGANNHDQTDEVCLLISPRILFLKDIQLTGYLKFDEKFSGTHYEIPSYYKDIRSLLSTGDIYRKMLSYAYVERGTFQAGLGTFPKPLFNQLTDLDLTFVHLNSPKADLGQHPFGESGIGGEHIACTIKQWIKPYNNLFELEYVRTHNGLYDTVTQTKVFGDCFIGEMSFKASYGSTSPWYFFNSETNEYETISLLFQNYYFSTGINTELRQRGEESYEHHWRAFYGTDIDFVNAGNPNGPFPPDTNINPNYFNLNRDMDLINIDRSYFTLPRAYDYCSDCNESFPTRIWYSQRAYQETVQDNYRVFLANDYRDLLSNGGEITNLFVYKDQLYAQTPETTWFVSTRPQELQSNEGTISVGTGDLLSIPPKRLETVDRGYAGNQDKFSMSVSEFGATFIDADAGKVFNFNGQLNELSAFGMRNWFAENLRFTGGVNDQINGFELNSTAHNNGIGFISTFDPRHNRYILHKKYYRIIDSEWLGGLFIADDYIEDVTIGFNSTTGEFYTWPLAGVVSLIDIQSNPLITENLSWTISFSYPHNAWMSYHSYKPNWMWHDRNNLYTYSNITNGSTDRFSWLHNTRDYGDYYNMIHPSTMYLIFNPSPYQTKVFNNFELVASSYTWIGDQLTKNEDDSLDEVFFHTERQSSGVLTGEVKSNYDLTNPFISVSYDLTTLQVQNNEDTWNLSKFYDLTSDYTLPIFTNDWSNPLYQQKRLDDGYIYYPNDLRTDFTKHQFDINPLRGKYLGCFFSYNNSSANKFVIDFLNTSQNISFK